MGQNIRAQQNKFYNSRQNFARKNVTIFHRPIPLIIDGGIADPPWQPGASYAGQSLHCRDR